jgi:hypothetical protein
MIGERRHYLPSRLREGIEGWAEQVGLALSKHADAGFTLHAHARRPTAIRKRKGEG